jgi:hypothetical protein
MWQVCRATTAAPGYFKEMEIDGERYIDGGFGYNDPSLSICDEITAKDQLNHAESPIALVLTLGTGIRPKFTAGRARGKLGRFRLLVRHGKRMSTGTQGVEKQMERDARQLRFRFVKWNGGETVGRLSMDDCKKEHFALMENGILHYMAQESVQIQLRDVARRLVELRRARCAEDGTGRWERFALCTQWKCPLTECSVRRTAEVEFRTRQDVRDHVTSCHPGLFADLEGALDRQGPTYPWKRGPFGHE